MPGIFALLVFFARIDYLEIPPLGRIASIAASERHLLVTNDQYLIFLDKNNSYRIIRTIRLDERPNLVGYDVDYGDFWITGINNIFRINDFTFTLKIFRVDNAATIRSFAIGPEYLYWYRGTNLFRFHKRTGKVEPGAGIPPEAKWFKMTTNEMLRKFPFLSPYYYNDEDFNRYSISAIFEDGLDLYVGTIGYGLFKYHRLTWEKSHITFGPYTGNIRVIYKDDSRFYFLGDRSISIYHWEGDSFSNFICKNNIEAFIPYQNRIYISSANRLLSFEGKFAYPISDLRNNVTTLTLDSNEIIFATTSGVYRLNPLSNSVLSLGLENIHINKIISDDSYIYAATKNGLYRYKRDSKIWERLINIPFLDIIRFDINRYYLISFNRQLYETNGDSLSALPYMNLTCFATDGELLYLGTLLGLDIYNPATRIYRSASFLPEEKINSMAIFLDTLWLATDKSLLKIATDKFK